MHFNHPVQATPVILQASTPQPVAIDIPLPSGSAFFWMALSAVGGFIATKVWPQWWGHYEKKEQQESEITTSLVNNLLQNNEKLLQGNLAGFQALEQSQRDVEKAIVKLGEQIQLEVQTTLKQQGVQYANLVQTHTEHNYLLKALHERYDKQELVLQVLAERMGLTEKKKPLGINPAKPRE